MPHDHAKTARTQKSVARVPIASSTRRVQRPRRSTRKQPTRRKPPTLIVVANRLPVHRVGSGPKTRWESSAGGLVTALEPVIKNLPGVWVGWSGSTETTSRPFTHSGIRITPIHLSRQEIEDFYHGMSNRTFWPLYHDAIRTPDFSQHWWKPYVRVNMRYAKAAAARAKKGDLVWVHDYHLQLVPAMIRALRPDVRIGFFLHIPFPPEELFEWLPWRKQVLEGLLGSDLVCFQTEKAAQNFSRLCRDYTEAEGTDHLLTYQNREIKVQAIPISIDFDFFNDRANLPQTQHKVEELRRRFGIKRKIVLAIDRLDYTKGVLRRLQAYEELLDRGHARVDNAVLVQIATPSRESVPDYARLRDDVERTVGRINGRFSEPGMVAVHYFRRNLTREELVAYYAAADIMLVTPLRDGMNLVAKEYVACRTQGSGVLVLSQFAGAAHELTRALIVNPRDQENFVHTLRLALKMPRDEAQMRMNILRSRVRRHDVFAWCQKFLETLAE